MNYAVSMAVVKGACNLTAELASLFFFELSMRNDVVQHLTAINVFKKHIPVVVCANNVTQPTNVGVAQESDDGSLTGGPDFFGLIGSFFICSSLVAIIGRTAGNDFARDL